MGAGDQCNERIGEEDDEASDRARALRNHQRNNSRQSPKYDESGRASDALPNQIGKSGGDPGKQRSGDHSA